MNFHQYCQSDHRCFWMQKTQLREGSVQPNVVSDSFKYTGMDRCPFCKIFKLFLRKCTSKLTIWLFHNFLIFGMSLLNRNGCWEGSQGQEEPCSCCHW